MRLQGRLDILAVWPYLAGPRLVIYHALDDILPHAEVSLVEALRAIKTPASGLKDGETIQLTTLKGRLQPGSYHNAPLHVRHFPTGATIDPN
jgi:hypothetical protein